MDVVIDYDGVLYEWDKTARYMQRIYRGHTGFCPMGKEATSWDYIQDHVTREDWEWLWTEGVELGLFRFGHLVTGAVMGLRSLVADGHRIIGATHRPPQAIRDTNAWLSLLDLPWHGQYILTKQQPKSSVKGDLLIDDRPENVAAWEGQTGKPGILFGRTWNEGASQFWHRIEGWDKVLQAVRELA